MGISEPAGCLLQMAIRLHYLLVVVSFYVMETAVQPRAPCETFMRGGGRPPFPLENEALLSQRDRSVIVFTACVLRLNCGQLEAGKENYNLWYINLYALDF